MFDSSEPDWTLVGLDGDFGFVPSNYIEFIDLVDASPPDRHPLQSLYTPRFINNSELADVDTPNPNWEGGRSDGSGVVTTLSEVKPNLTTMATSLASEADSERTISHHPPSLSKGSITATSNAFTPRSQDEFLDEQLPISINRICNPSQDGHRKNNSELNKVKEDEHIEKINEDMNDRAYMDSRWEGMIQASPAADNMRATGAFHLYNINEMISVLGKKKKLPLTLGVNIATRTILIAPARTSDGPSQEWPAEKMTHYSQEGKHVYLELIRPGRSIDFHAGAKDTAEEIVGALGELADVVRADRLRDAVTIASTKQVTGVVLYDFAAQGAEEVTVESGDDVVILEGDISEEWCTVRRSKNDKIGVVPRRYIEVTGPFHTSLPSTLPNPVGFTVEQNRLDEKHLTSEVAKSEPRNSTSTQNHVRA